MLQPSVQYQSQAQSMQAQQQAQSQPLFHQSYDNAQMYQTPMTKQSSTTYNSQFDSFLANQGYGQNPLPSYQQQSNHAQMSQMFANQQHYPYNKQNPNQQNLRNQPIKYRDK